MAHIKVYIVTTLYLYRDYSDRYTANVSDWYTPYLYTNRKTAMAYIKRITDRWEKEGYYITNEPTDIEDKLSNFNKCIWEYINITKEDKRVIILDPTLTF